MEVVEVEETDVLDFVDTVVDELPPVDDTVPVPVPTEVVMGPDSMYTPEMYQFSGVAVLTIRRIPTWKSSELVLWPH